jgi:hypothetical protein
MTDGSKCHAIAMRDKPYCFYHMRLHRVMGSAMKPSKSKERTFDFTFPDSKASIQLAIFQVMKALGSSEISPKRASSLLYSMQIASQNVPQSVDTIPDRPVTCVYTTPEGDELAPDCISLELPHGCIDCINPDANCPMLDKTQTRILQIAHGVDEDETEQCSFSEKLKQTIMRQLDGGASLDARLKIIDLIHGPKTNT